MSYELPINILRYYVHEEQINKIFIAFQISITDISNKILEILSISSVEDTRRFDWRINLKQLVWSDE